MIALAAAFLGLVIGMLIGAFGGGGAVVTVPILVLLLNRPVAEAIATSVVVVLVAALIGLSGYLREHRVCWTTALTYIAIGLPFSLTAGHLSIGIPQQALLFGFAAVMLVSAGATLTKSGRRRSSDISVESCGPVRRTRIVAMVTTAAVVGTLTGLLGVGGGFIIVPALIVALDLPVGHAVGTSLAVIAANSVITLIPRVGTVSLELAVVLPCVLAAVAGALLGKHLGSALDPARFQRVLAWIMTLLALWVGAGAVSA